MTPTVYVVDDDPAIRSAVGRLVQSVELDVVTFASTKEFLEYDRHDGSGCLVLDVRLPDESGLDLQRRLADDSLPIVSITGYGTISMSVRATQAGAVDSLEKPFDEQDGIHKAIGKDNRQRQVREAKAAVEQRVMKLTHRELDVFEGVVTGVSNKQIGRDLGVSEKTVKIHRARVTEEWPGRSQTSSAWPNVAASGHQERPVRLRSYITTLIRPRVFARTLGSLSRSITRRERTITHIEETGVRV